MQTRHVSVLKGEVLDYLQAEKGGAFLDCTFGGGGHSQAILELNPHNRVHAIDRDKRALTRATHLTEQYQERLTLQHGTFEELSEYCAGERFDGIIADLGLSTDQLFEERGFSFRDSDSLDMRMDEEQSHTADQIINELSERELKKVFLRGGVGKEAHHIVKAIVRERPIATAKDLGRIIEQAIPQSARKKGVHPATVAFQAIRIAVNREIEQIEALLEAAPKLISQNGRLAIISFHSLEDKLVAKKMRSWEGGEFSALWPGQQEQTSSGKLLTKKAVVPSKEEQEQNPSSRSARLRVFEFSLDA